MRLNQVHEPEPPASGIGPILARPNFWRIAAHPRMIGMLVAFLLVAAVCGALGQWQLSRAVERGNLAKEHAAAELEAAGPTVLGELLAPQQSFPGRLVGRSATVTGTFEPDHTVLIPGRVLDGELGWLVVTALRVSDDGSAGENWRDLSGPPMLAVVRGWLPAVPDGAAALPDGAAPDFSTAPVPPAPPSGTVTITGYLQSSEAATEDTVASGQVESISTGQLVNSWGGPTYSGYLVLSVQGDDWEGDLSLMPRPTIEGGGLNIQNLAYAVQWWIFGFFAVFLWVRMIRDAQADESAHPDEVAQAPQA